MRPFAHAFAASSIALAAMLLPSRAAAQDDRPFVGEAFEVRAGTSILVTVPSRIERVIVTDPAIADAQPISAEEALLLGRSPGTTDIVFRLENGESVWRRLRVVLDADDLQQRLQRLFGLDLAVEDTGGTIAVRGTVPDLSTGVMLREYMDKAGHSWIDLTRIAGVQQVQLRVRIAEASRQALRELAFGAVSGGGTAFGGIQSPGGTSPFQPVSIAPLGGVASPVDNARFAFGANAVSSATTLFGGIPGSSLEIFLRALDENRYVRLLAEPNLVAVSGEEATFLVGGEFPIPVVQGSALGGGQTVTIQFKEFGVRLTFRPEVLGDGRIRLEVAPEVSEVSQIGALNQGGFTVPSVVVRRSSTTVELGSGQSFAMAGLLRSNEQARISRVPFLGDLPVLGVLFRSVRYEEEQTELVVMVTAELVEPISDGAARPLPGDLHETPDDWELFIEGSTNGTAQIGSPLARLKTLGLDGIRGPGAWRRPDEPRVPAADPLPEVPAAAEPAPASDGGDEAAASEGAESP
jgi:pilus assembly protein CpaC